MSEFDSGSDFDGGSVDSGSSSPVETTTPISTGGDTGQQSSGDSFNPAWQPFLSDLPEYFHGKAKEHFKTWDQNYEKLNTDYRGLQDKVKPYEQYLSVDPTNLQYAMNVYQAINSDPKRVYDLLTKQLEEMGLLGGSTEQQQPGRQDQSVESYDPAYQELDERQRKLDERQQHIDEYIKQQEYNAEVSKHENAIDSQVKAVVSKYGDAVDVEDLLQRMYVQSQQGRDFNAEAAFNEQKATFQRLYQRQATTKRPAPNIIPTNGTPAPTQEKKPEDMSEDERKAYFKQLLDMANTGG